MPDNYITLSQLTKTTKGLVNKINAESTVINTNMGDLANLTTTAKTNLVAAINEAASTGGGATYDDTALAGRVTALENAGYITSYTETDPTVPAWAKEATKPTYTAAEVGAVDSSTLNNYVKKEENHNGNIVGINSSFTGLGPSLTLNTQGNGTATITLASEDSQGPTISISSMRTNITGVVTPTSNNMAANKKYVDDSIAAISIPTKTSDLTNDSGYITSYTETDPTVPAWAKAASKPTYTAAEVGALPDTTVIPQDKIFPVNVTLTSTSGGTSDKTHTEIFAAVNAGKIPVVYLSYASYSIIGILNHCNSASANFTYINQTDTQVSFKYAQIKIVNDIASITSNVDVFALKDEIPTTTSQLTNDSGYITNADIPPIPTSTSNLINDSGFLTSIELADVATSGSYNDLVDTPTIPAAQVQSDWNATSGMGVILNKPTIPAATTVTNTLASGTLIATINGTNIYAPAYVDADGVSY